MSAFPARLQVSLPRPADKRVPVAIAVVACLAWTVVTLGGITHEVAAFVDVAEWCLIGGPLVTAFAVLLARPHSPLALRVALCWTLAVAVAVKGIEVTGTNEILGFAPLIVAVLAILVADRQIVTVATIVAVAGGGFSIKAYTGLPVAVVADGLMVAAWLAIGWGWATGTRATPRWFPVAFALLGAYILMSFVSGFVAEDTTQGLYGFRFTAFYISAVLLVAFYVEGEERRAKALYAVLGVCTAVLAYAMYRLLVGPGAQESEVVLAEGANYVSNNLGEVRLFGSLPGPYVLAAWAASSLALGATMAMCPLAVPVRLCGLALVAMSGVAIAEADSRSAMVGTAAGLVVVIVLFALARAFPGRKAFALTFAMVLLAGGAAGFVAFKLNSTDGDAERFRGLLDPLNDYSVQDRFVKWETTLAEVRGKPFGNGVGSSGNAEVRYARFRSAASYEPDSSYVKVIYDQGYIGLAVLGSGLVLLLVGLGGAAIRAPDPRDSASAIGAAGATVALFVSSIGGPYHEGQHAVVVYVLCGLAMGSVVQRSVRSSTETVATPASDAASTSPSRST